MPGRAREFVGGAQFVILNEVKNPVRAHRRTRRTNNWILRFAQNDRIFESSLA